jgi:PKD repeat protein
MPLEPQFRKAIEAQWTFKVIDEDQRIVSFKDRSQGEITGWKWDFGDGSTSTEQNPTHQYKAKPGKAGIYTVILNVTGPAGTSRMSKVWEVHVRG